MKIPKHAKRVFKGIIFEVYQWPQKMFDGSTATFEAAKREDTVVVIPEHKGKIVALRQKQPGSGWFYCTPSGRMDVPDESPKNAALRELLEETGMRPAKLKLWKVIKKEGKLKWNIYFYLAHGCKVVAPQKLDKGEKIKVKLLTFDQYLKLSDHPTHWIQESLVDMFKARLSAKYYNYLKKAFLG